MTKEAVDYMTFGERIVYTRKQKGLQQKQLARLIGVKPSTVNGWEKGKRHPDVSMVQRIKKALEVPDDWFENDDKFRKISQKVKPVMRLTKEQQELVAENENVIGAVFQKFVRKYCPMMSYDQFYGDAAISLCRAAYTFGKHGGKKGSFFSYAFVSIKNSMLSFYHKEGTYLHHTTSLNKIIGQDDHGTDVELCETIPSPDDEYERIEYRILAESAYQKVEPVLGKKEKKAFRLWLLGNENPEIAKVLGVSQHTSLCRILRAKTKCRDSFNADEIFS